MIWIGIGIYLICGFMWAAYHQGRRHGAGLSRDDLTQLAVQIVLWLPWLTWDIVETIGEEHGECGKRK